MKRSEMLNLMENVWYMYTRDLTPDKCSVRNGMIEVLSAMIYEGVLPPWNTKMSKGAGNDYGEIIELGHRWEPEDD